MTHLIDRDTLVEELNKLIKKNELYLNDNVSDAIRFQKTGAYSVLCDLRHFLDSLEVKEVQEEPYAMSDTGSYTTTTHRKENKL